MFNKALKTAFLSLLISGCTLTPTSSNIGSPSVLDYQSHLNILSQEEFSQELATVKQAYKQNQEYTALKLGLLYGHKSSPVKNPHQAKRYLDKVSTVELSSEDKIALDMYMTQLKDTLSWQHKYEDALIETKALQNKLNQLKEVEQLINLRENER